MIDIPTYNVELASIPVEMRMTKKNDPYFILLSCILREPFDAKLDVLLRA